MNIRLRRAYYVVVALLFLVLAPVLIFYAMGWRYDWSSKRFLRTGVLNVSSDPSKARIFIDDALISEKTPAVLSNILPGRHKVEVEKEGYSSWFKWLDVRPERATFTDRIILFPENPLSKVLWREPLSFIFPLGNDGGVLFITAKNEVWLSAEFPDLENMSNLIFFGRLSSAFDHQNFEASLSPSKKKMLLATESGLAIIDFDQRLLQEQIFDGVLLSRVMWWTNDDLVYLNKRNGSVFQYSLLDRTSEELISPTVLDFFVNNDQIFFAKKIDSQKTSLVQFKNGNERFIIDLSSSDGYRFEGVFSGLLTLLDPGERLFFLEPSGGAWILEEVPEDVFWIDWLPDTRHFLFGNEWELYFYDYALDSPEALLRSAEIISETVWHPSGRAVFIAINDQLRVRELDQRDRVNTYILWDHPVQNVFIDGKARFLYFIDRDDGYLKRLDLVKD